MKPGRPKLPAGSRFFSIQLPPPHQAIARKLGGQITQGVRRALESSMSEEERKSEVAKLLECSLKINKQLDVLNAERQVISEKIYALQKNGG